MLVVAAAGEAGRHALLVAPTGGGKTLAGFLPSLVELARVEGAGHGYLENGEAYQAGMTVPVYLSWMYFLTASEW